MKKIFLLMLSTVLFSCIGRKRDASDFDYKKIEKIADSIKIQNITVHNLFKSQILAHRSKDFDSAMIPAKFTCLTGNFGTAAMELYLVMIT
jgi:hypothetical protein